MRRSKGILQVLVFSLFTTPAMASKECNPDKLTMDAYEKCIQKHPPPVDQGAALLRNMRNGMTGATSPNMGGSVSESTLENALKDHEKKEAMRKKGQMLGHRDPRDPIPGHGGHPIVLNPGESCKTTMKDSHFAKTLTPKQKGLLIVNKASGKSDTSSRIAINQPTPMRKH